MAKNTEVEIKFQITDLKIGDDILAALQSGKYGQPDLPWFDTLEAYYYDTPDKALHRCRLAYRIRREKGCWVATVKGGGKSAGGLHTRQEYNVVVDGCLPSIAPFVGTDIGDKLQDAIGESRLELLFITRFERRALMVKMPDDSVIEAAVDRGEIVAGNKQDSILELELELKSGDTGTLLKLGAVLAERYPLLLESRSKYYRGLLLAGIVQDACAGQTNTIGKDMNLSNKKPGAHK